MSLPRTIEAQQWGRIQSTDLRSYSDESRHRGRRSGQRSEGAGDAEFDTRVRRVLFQRMNRQVINILRMACQYEARKPSNDRARQNADAAVEEEVDCAARTCPVQSCGTDGKTDQDACLMGASSKDSSNEHPRQAAAEQAHDLQELIPDGLRSQPTQL